MKQILLLNLLIFITYTAYCQNKIEGSVHSKNESIPYASVVLYSFEDLVFYKASLSDSVGSFLLEDIADGRYILKIQNVGFSDYTDTLSLSKESGNFIHLGNIKLIEAVIGLQGVEVVAKRPIIERINNLTVMNVELASVFVGSDAFELLKKVPGVFVDKDGNISLYYKTVLVTIDNKELNLGADELVSFLKSIPFEEVSKLEINPNPTANFDAEGAGGIINIVTKKRVHNGIQGRVNVNTSFAFNEFRLGAGINASLSAKINKFTIVASMGIQYHPQYEKIQSTEKMLTDQGVFERKINNKNDKHWSLDNGYTMPFVRFELDYDINAKSSISLSFRANHSSRKGSDQSYNRLFFNS
ncbi:MAG: hypothetical protein RR190_06405, partial [Bacteroidales bacterium]